MANKFTEKEVVAIESKINNPEEVVYCPRCGKELMYRSVGNSVEVKCDSLDCIKASIRGI